MRKEEEGKHWEEGGLLDFKIQAQRGLPISVSDAGQCGLAGPYRHLTMTSHHAKPNNSFNNISSATIVAMPDPVLRRSVVKIYKGVCWRPRIEGFQNATHQ
jgi:hypothetical protein